MARYTDRVFIPPAPPREPCEALDSPTADLWACDRYLRHLANGLTVVEAIKALQQEVAAYKERRYQ